MKRYLLLGLVVALGWGVAPGAAKAENSWLLTGYGGWTRNMNNPANSNGGFGGRINAFIRAGKIVGLGLEVGQSRFGSIPVDSVFVPGTMLPTRGEVDQWMWTFTGEALFIKQLGPVRPFLIGGAGLYPVTYNIKLETGFRLTEKRIKFGYNAGLGLDIPVSESGWSVGLDARYTAVPSASFTSQQLRDLINGNDPGEATRLDVLMVYLGLGYNVGLPFGS